MMNESPQSSSYLICHVCTHRNAVDDINQGFICERCGHKSRELQIKSPKLTLVFALTALIFYLPANMFPFMTIELYGNRSTSTIWGGVVSLVNDGSWPIALVIFLASLLIPCVKLIILFYLGLTAKSKKHPEFKTKLYFFVEAIGRWSMLDIFLLAILVAIMKLGAWTTVQPEPGSLMFLLVVIFTMLASAQFDPQILWREENDNADETKTEIS